MNQLKNFAFTLLITSSLFYACQKETTEAGERLWINKERVTCQGFIEQTCYEIQRGDILGTNWELFYDPIEDFDTQYEVGFIYQIEVEVTEIENPPQDASSRKYKLIKVISKD